MMGGLTDGEWCPWLASAVSHGPCSPETTVMESPSGLLRQNSLSRPVLWATSNISAVPCPHMVISSYPKRLVSDLVVLKEVSQYTGIHTCHVAGSLCLIITTDICERFQFFKKLKFERIQGYPCNSLTQLQERCAFLQGKRWSFGWEIEIMHDNLCLKCQGGNITRNWRLSGWYPDPGDRWSKTPRYWLWKDSGRTLVTKTVTKIQSAQYQGRQMKETGNLIARAL